MPVYIIWKLVGAAAIGAAGYMIKKLAEDSELSSDYRSSDEVNQDNELRRREAKLEQQRNRMDAYARAVLDEHGIKLKSSEHDRLVSLALCFADDPRLDELVAEIALRARAVRDMDERIETTESEAAALEDLAEAFVRLARDRT